MGTKRRWAGHVRRFLIGTLVLAASISGMFASYAAAGSVSQDTTPNSSDVTKEVATPIGPMGMAILEYRIASLDMLEVSVYQEKDLEKVVRVSQSGHITYPLIGKVNVAGMTVFEIEEKLQELLQKDYLVNPQVTVFIKKYHSKKVYVLGAVKKPGSYEFPFEKELTVLEAISQAGGFTDVAAQDKTKIIRLEDGVEKQITVKITDITKRGEKSKDLVLKPNDIIVVPETFF